MKNYNVTINGQNAFDQPIKTNIQNMIRRAIWQCSKIVTGQGNDCTTGYMLDYNYSKNYYKVIAEI